MKMAIQGVGMKKIVAAKPLENYRVWLKFSDGLEGIADLSGLAGKGMFKVWEDANFFNSVFIDSQTHTIAWEGGIDLCPDKLYADLAGEDPLSVLDKGKAVSR